MFQLIACISIRVIVMTKSMPTKYFFKIFPKFRSNRFMIVKEICKSIKLSTTLYTTHIKYFTGKYFHIGNCYDNVHANWYRYMGNNFFF